MSELSRTVDHDFDTAVERVTATLADEGFGVLTTIEVDKVLKKKIDVDFRRYTILGACNPGFAHQALQADLVIGTLLPCNVVVYETDDGAHIEAVDPATMLPDDTPEVAGIADEVRERLARAVARA